MRLGEAAGVDATGPEIHVLRPDELGLLDELPPEVGDDLQGKKFSRGMGKGR